MEKKTDTKEKAVIIILLVAILLAIAFIAFVIFYNMPYQRLKRNLTLADKYLDELEYDEAVLAYRLALEIDPKSKEAYIGLADAYIGLDDYDMAHEIIEQGIEVIGPMEALLQKLIVIEEQIKAKEDKDIIGINESGDSSDKFSMETGAGDLEAERESQKESEETDDDGFDFRFSHWGDTLEDVMQADTELSNTEVLDWELADGTPNTVFMGDCVLDGEEFKVVYQFDADGKLYYCNYDCVYEEFTEETVGEAKRIFDLLKNHIQEETGEEPIFRQQDLDGNLHVDDENFVPEEGQRYNLIAMFQKNAINLILDISTMEPSVRAEYTKTSGKPTTRADR